jgi:hypothetical protein
MIKMNYTLKIRPPIVSSNKNIPQQPQNNYEINQAYLRMSMMDRIKHNGEPCKSCGK